MVDIKKDRNPNPGPEPNYNPSLASNSPMFDSQRLLFGLGLGLWLVLGLGLGLVLGTVYEGLAAWKDREFEGSDVHYLGIPMWQTTADHTLKWHS